MQVSFPADSPDVESSMRPVEPIRVAALLAVPGRFVLEHTTRTGSTNDDLARLPAGGAEPYRVRITEEQVAGRGRSGRVWSCPAGAGLMFSVRLALPTVPVERRGWIGAVLGLAIVRTIGRHQKLTAELKWPNDVLIRGAKCAGILGELVGDEVIVGSGINVTIAQHQLPRRDATSLLLAGASNLNRESLLAGILDNFDDLVSRWRDAAGDVDASGIRAEYRDRCATLSREVRIELPGGESVRGRAVDVDAGGAIVVRMDSGAVRSFSAGDVVHLRPA